MSHVLRKSNLGTWGRHSCVTKSQPSTMSGPFPPPLEVYEDSTTRKLLRNPGTKSWVNRNMCLEVREWGESYVQVIIQHLDAKNRH